MVIPVSDADRAKQFYGNLGWRLDADFAFDNGFRVVQFTPPGSACSVQFGTKITAAAPGSAQGTYLIVSDIEAARDALAARGVKVSEVFHAATPGAQFQPDGASGRVSGPTPDHGSYRSFANFSDPDGNGWLLQEITTRLPGRMDLAQRRSPRRMTWRTHFDVRRPLTASTRNVSGTPTRTGPTGTPSTWSASRLGKECAAMNAQREPELLGQTVVVIGGSGGIGLETARRARAEGADVILTARDPERLQRAARELDALSTAAFDADRSSRN